ncbi:helix-turn-helix domain-containing protein [Caldibacillus lycopersici]|uniref:Helix-turn-helix domain-containing protein n=1 Tax=Perspicuibacillus lycopersici TaxID=1325689 RepID=A0AAE3LM36_9BACI|nr:helix-turn-helix domain-containing protein [Perspicuibacillus lycopersici]MCU9612536.1 helix-turn-helix domain-containing protein [Perspicuibacillus lycopersici]
MLKNIRAIIPEAIIQDSPITEADYLCFYDAKTSSYIGMPKTSITEREKLLLESIYTLIENAPVLLNYSASQKLWYEFLVDNGTPPSTSDRRYRLIHFHLDKKENQHNFSEAIQSFFQKDLIIVWINDHTGVVIEEESEDVLVSSDFLSLTEAIISDFSFLVDLYIGRFAYINDWLKDYFHREQHYFHTTKSMMPKEHIFTFEKSFPLVIMATKGEQLGQLLQKEWKEIFQDDMELLSTIKMFLENNSNTSLTAKKLYLHRNSLQYRIDKFIERTSIDIKGFQGAISVYFICLYGESH